MGHIVIRRTKDRNHPQVYTTPTINFMTANIDPDALKVWIRNKPTTYMLDIDDVDGTFTVSYVAAGANAADLKPGWPGEDGYRLNGTTERLCNDNSGQNNCTLPTNDRKALVNQRVATWNDLESNPPPRASSSDASSNGSNE